MRPLSFLSTLALYVHAPLYTTPDYTSICSPPLYSHTMVWTEPVPAALGAGEVETKDYSSTLARGEAPITHHGRLAVQLWTWDPTIPRQAPRRAMPARPVAGPTG